MRELKKEGELNDETKSRYIEIKGSLDELCPSTSYTLSFSIYDNILDKCNNVGPTLGNSLGIILTDITSTGGLMTVDIAKKEGLVVLPSTIDPNYIVGGSCVLRMNHGSFGFVGPQPGTTTGSTGNIPNGVANGWWANNPNGGGNFPYGNAYGWGRNRN